MGWLRQLLASLLLAQQTYGSKIDVAPRADELASSPTSPGVPPRCSPPAVQIPNPGFEAGIKPWGQFQVGRVQAITLQPGHNSKTSVELSMLEYHARKGGPTVAQFQMPVCPAVTYQMTFDYKIDRNEPRCAVYIRVGDSDPSPREFGTTPYTGGIAPIALAITPWSTSAFNFSSDFYPFMWFALGMGCEPSATNPNASVFFDNFAVKAVGTTEPPGCPKAVGVENGGFESGALSPWVLAPAAPDPRVTHSIVSPGRNSTHMLKVDFAGPINSHASFQLQHPQLNRCVAYNYTFSFDYRFTNLAGKPANNSASMSIDLGSCYSVGTDATNQVEAQPAADWRHVTFHCRARKSAASSLTLAVQTVQAPDGIPSFSLLLDNVDITLDPSQ